MVVDQPGERQVCYGTQHIVTFHHPKLGEGTEYLPRLLWLKNDELYTPNGVAESVTSGERITILKVNISENFGSGTTYRAVLVNECTGEQKSSEPVTVFVQRPNPTYFTDYTTTQDSISVNWRRSSVPHCASNTTYHVSYTTLSGIIDEYSGSTYRTVFTFKHLQSRKEYLLSLFTCIHGYYFCSDATKLYVSTMSTSKLTTVKLE